MSSQTITLPICAATDPYTGIITAFVDGDYATVTQAANHDQLHTRMLKVKNLVDKARKKYNFVNKQSQPEPTQRGGLHFESSELTYQVLA